MKRSAIKFSIAVCFAVIAAALALTGCGAKSVRVTFDGNGGTPESVSVEAFEGDPLPGAAVPTRDGYIFTGWYTSADCEESERFGADRRLNGSIVLYAGWAEASGFNTVRFDINADDAEAPNDVRIRSGSLVPEPPKPVRDGYVFDGWYAEGETETPFDFLNQPVDADISLRAEWKKLCKITVAADGETRTFEVVQGAPLASVSAPYIEGKYCLGLYYDEQCTDKIIGGAAERDMTLYAAYAKPTDLKLYNIEKNDYNDGDFTVSLKADSVLDELVLPETVDGETVRFVRFDSTDVPFKVKRLVLPASVEGIYEESFENDRYIESFDAAAANKYFIGYGGCLYSVEKNYFDVGNGEADIITSTHIKYVPHSVNYVKLMENTDGVYCGGSKVFYIDYAPTQYMKRRGFSTDKHLYVVADEYFDDYGKDTDLSQNNAVYREAQLDTEKMRVTDGETLVRYFGASDKPAIAGNGDGITALANDAFYGIRDITVGADIKIIGGHINSEYVAKPQKVVCTFSGCPEEVNIDINGLIYADRTYRIYPQYADDFKLLGVQNFADYEFIGDEDFVIDENGVLLRYRGNETKVTLPEGLTDIDEHAFKTDVAVTDITVSKLVGHENGYYDEIFFYVYNNLENGAAVNVTLPVELTFDLEIKYCFRISVMSEPDTQVGAVVYVESLEMSNGTAVDYYKNLLANSFGVTVKELVKETEAHA